MLNSMKRWAVATTACLVLATAAAAQTRTKADVPFDFEINGKKFTAGQYCFDPNRLAFGLHMQTSEGEQHAYITYELGNPAGTPNPRLVFYKDGSTYHLAQVWLADRGAGRAMPVRKDVAFSAKNGRAERIEVALSRR